jgi:hypothetical protein
MRSSTMILLLVFCFSPFVSGQKTRLGQVTEKPNPADYAIKVHVSKSQIRPVCVSGLCNDLLYADAVLNGKKIELSGTDPIVKKTLMLIAPGDYPVKLTKDNHNSDGTLFSQNYDLLLSDGTVWHCWTSGISE